MGTKRVVATLPDDMGQALKEVAKSTDRTEAQIIRDALKEYFRKQGRSVRSGLKWGGLRDKKE